MLDVAVQDRTDRVAIRAISPVDGSELTLTSGTLVIYNEGNSEVVASTAATVSGSAAHYERTWTKATFPTGRYRIVWSLVVSGPTTHVFDSNFEVVVRRFRRPIGDSDFSTRYPYLSGLLPTGATFDMYLNTAWSKIESVLYARLGRYPGNLIYPEQLQHCLEQWALADIYQAVSIGPGSEDEAKADRYKLEAMASLDTAMAFVREDTDEDKSAEDDEYAIIQGAELVR